MENMKNNGIQAIDGTENNGVQAIDDTQAAEVVGGFSSLTNLHIKKTRCDNCERVIQEGEHRLHSADNKHHLCHDCFNNIKNESNYKDATGTPAYVKRIKNMYDIDV